MALRHSCCDRAPESTAFDGSDAQLAAGLGRSATGLSKMGVDVVDENQRVLGTVGLERNAAQEASAVEYDSLAGEMKMRARTADRARRPFTG